MGFKVSIFSVLFIIMSAVILQSSLRVARSDVSVIRVPDDYPTIQAAIDAALNGTTILVNDGVYHENLHINKTLSLLGADRENTTIDGSNFDNTIIVSANGVLISGFTVRNSTDLSSGILLENSNRSTIIDNIITLNPREGLTLSNSNNNTIEDNIISNTGLPGGYYGTGIDLTLSNNSTISNNLIIWSYAIGIYFEDSRNNTLFRNTIEGAPEALIFYRNAFNNTFFDNNLINFQSPFYSADVSANDSAWSVGGRGNYWYDYVGLDDGSGGRIASDGVGDTNLPWEGVDDYPLASPVNPIEVFWNNQIFPGMLFTNSTAPALSFDQPSKKITFTVIGSVNTTGYFNISIPTTLLSGPWKILLNQTDVTSKTVITENETYATIYLSYDQGSGNVELIGTNVIPEYPSLSTIFSAILLLSTTIAMFATKKLRKGPAHASYDF